jgi:hypothetical protein
MNKSFVLMSLFAALMFSQAANAQGVRGNGNLVKQERNVGSFDEIQSYGSFDVVITDGNDSKVTVEAEENLQQFIVVETSGDKLNIRHKRGENFRATKTITIHITAPALEAIRLSGSGNIKSTNLLDGSNSFEIKSSGSGNIDVEVQTGAMKASISGSGNIRLKGSTKELDGSIAGSGNIRAKDFTADVTTVHISGSGSAEVVANEKLDSRIAGSGDVKYWGNASVNSKIAGSGSVRREK